MTPNFYYRVCSAFTVTVTDGVGIVPEVVLPGNYLGILSSGVFISHDGKFCRRVVGTVDPMSLPLQLLVNGDRPTFQIVTEMRARPCKMDGRQSRLRRNVA